ncbi:MAG: type II toxin-antitoxin system prevent-host-death family antitoxin [Spirochaetota bacterium]
MKITSKELRMRPGKIIAHAASGFEVIVTHRGKPVAKIVPLKTKIKEEKDISIFGMWKNRNDINDVNEYVRTLRKGRNF